VKKNLPLYSPTNFWKKKEKMSSNSNTYLFYSNACVHCIELLKVMKETGVLNKLKLICVDKVDHNKLPKFVKSVPTVFFKKSNQVMTGESIFQWLDKQYGTRSDDNRQSQRTCTLGSRDSGANASSIPDKEDNDIIEAWIETEWGNNSFSDSYSFLSDCPSGVCRNFALIDESSNYNNSFSNHSTKPAAVHHIQGGGGKFDFLDRSKGFSSNDDNLQVCNQRLQQMKMEREKFY
jgi:glutaredoxin